MRANTPNPHASSSLSPCFISYRVHHRTIVDSSFDSVGESSSYTASLLAQKLHYDREHTVQGLWQLVSVVLQDWDSRSWSHARAGTTVPREKCRGWCLSHAPLKCGTADFTHSTKNALRPSLERPSYQCPERLSKRFISRIRTVPPCFLSFISV
jgi:hypothetical protein